MIIQFSELHLTCEIHIVDRVTHNSLTHQHFCASQVVHSLHVSVKTDEKVYNWKTATISFIILLIVLMIYKFFKRNMPQ
jgi:hypothetical protein